MCNTCVQPGQSLLKGSGREYILYAARLGKKPDSSINPVLSTFSTHPNTPYFSTHIFPRKPLVNRTLSTFYTGPINTITTYINK
jgi:hypothetical protein